jgi:hypothetical protein
MEHVNSRPVLFNDAESAAEINVYLMVCWEVWRRQRIQSLVRMWVSDMLALIHELKAVGTPIKYRSFLCDVVYPTDHDS